MINMNRKDLKKDKCEKETSEKVQFYKGKIRKRKMLNKKQMKRTVLGGRSEKVKV